MQSFRNAGCILIAYCIPYIIVIYLITYYFDYVTKQYPTFLPAIVLILILIPIYIGLGCICGRKSLLKICIFGTAVHFCICKLCITFLLPALSINNGVARAWFPIWAGFIVGCQLIGYWGMK